MVQAPSHASLLNREKKDYVIFKKESDFTPCLLAQSRFMNTGSTDAKSYTFMKGFKTRKFVIPNPNFNYRLVAKSLGLNHL